jgi:hypothetical protein
VVLAVLGVCGCDDPTPTPAPTTQGLSAEEMMADFGVYDVTATPGDIASSQATLNAAAVAVEMRDITDFVSLLSEDYKRDFASADFSGVDTAGFASALRNARLSKSNQYSIIYDTTAGGLTFQITMIKEDGVWKIEAM